MAESNKELALKDNQFLSPTSGGKEYGIDLGEEDFIMPRLILLQPTSDEDGAGKFYLGLTGEKFDSLDVVFFSNSRGRVMFDPDMSKGISICGSDNRVTPSARYESPKSDKCVDCKFSKRDYYEEIVVGKDKVREFCSETQILKGMIIDTLTPFIFSARRTALLPINMFLSGVLFDAKKFNKPLCCFPVKLSSDIPKKAKTKYYVPVIERLGMIEREEFLAMMKKYESYDINKTFEQEEEKINKDVPDSDDIPF